MIDQYPNWRNHRWSFDAEFCDTEDAPILEGLIKKWGSMVDDVYFYKLRGRCKQYIIRWKHYNTPDMDYHMPRDHVNHYQGPPKGQTTLQ